MLEGLLSPPGEALQLSAKRRLLPCKGLFWQVPGSWVALKWNCVTLLLCFANNIQTVGSHCPCFSQLLLLATCHLRVIPPGLGASNSSALWVKRKTPLHWEESLFPRLAEISGMSEARPGVLCKHWQPPHLPPLAGPVIPKSTLRLSLPLPLACSAGVLTCLLSSSSVCPHVPESETPS